MKNSNLILLVAVGVYLAITFWYFPSFFASIDEHEYIRNSLLLQTGSLIEKDLTQACVGKPAEGGYVSQFFIGRSAFLVPFTWFGFDAVLASGMVIHILNFLLFVLLFRRLNISPIYAILYLFYPLFVWESRTINSELLVLTGLLGATYLYLSKKSGHHALSGFVFGITLFVRLDAVLLLPGFFLLPAYRDRKKFVMMLAGFIPALLLVAGANSLFYGGILKTGYGNPLRFLFDIGTSPIFFQNAIKYAAILSLAYPLLLFSPLRGPLRWEAVGGIAYIVFYLQHSFTAVFPLVHPTVFTSQLRYLLPFIGILLLNYPPLLEGILKKLRLPEKSLFVIFAGMVVITIVASSVHATFLDGRETVYEEIYAHTTPGSLLIGSSDDCNYVLPAFFGNRSYIDAGNANRDTEIQRFSDVYILDVSYGTVDYSSVRGNTIAKERKAVKDYLASVPTELVFESASPHSVKIYKKVG